MTGGSRRTNAVPIDDSLHVGDELAPYLAVRVHGWEQDLAGALRLDNGDIQLASGPVMHNPDVYYPCEWGPGRRTACIVRTSRRVITRGYYRGKARIEVHDVCEGCMPFWEAAYVKLQRTRLQRICERQQAEKRAAEALAKQRQDVSPAVTPTSTVLDSIHETLQAVADQ